jgi:hypothetical protein
MVGPVLRSDEIKSAIPSTPSRKQPSTIAVMISTTFLVRDIAISFYTCVKKILDRAPLL